MVGRAGADDVEEFAHRIPRRTRAIVPDGFGAAADVLHLTEVDRPGLGDDEVLPSALAAGADRGDRHVASAVPQPLRLAGGGTGNHAPRTPVPDPQLAGWVDAIGGDATAEQFAVTTKAPVVPRWPTYRTMRLDQPGR